MDFETIVEFAGDFPGTMRCQNGMIVEYSPPVELNGMKGPMTPEDAFIGAANMCYQIVFRSIAAGLGLKVLSYKCRAVGDLQTVEGSKRFVVITMYPEISFEHGSNMANLEKALEATKRKCLVTNSMSCEVRIEHRVI
ncbi:MAG: OsmC family protein [Candidatus Thermoplasmatota archaeon]|nr:OsmC family protein [Candidatus Thermoplasmatota archaeon]